MELIPYVSLYYANSPNLIAEMDRVLRECQVDGIYTDGWIGYRDDWRAGYELVRKARALLGERTFYAHTSHEPYGNPRVYSPFVNACFD